MSAEAIEALERLQIAVLNRDNFQAVNRDVKLVLDAIMTPIPMMLICPGCHTYSIVNARPAPPVIPEPSQADPTPTYRCPVCKSAVVYHPNEHCNDCDPMPDSDEYRFQQTDPKDAEAMGEPVAFDIEFDDGYSNLYYPDDLDEAGEEEEHGPIVNKDSLYRAPTSAAKPVGGVADMLTEWLAVYPESDVISIQWLRNRIAAESNHAEKP